MGIRFSVVLQEVIGSDICLLIETIIYNNNLRFLTNIYYNTNVVDFADLGRSKSSSGATCFWANSAFAYKAISLEIKTQNQKQ
jgi:hypothetical protein